jgi:Protein of unknown function (DUF4239)
MENFIDGLIHFDLSRYSVGAFYILVFIGLSVAGQVLVKRLMGVETIALCHEVGGYYMAIVGSLYAVVLGLVIYDAISTFQNASLCVKDEAKAMLAVYALADQFPNNGKDQIKALSTSYVDEVVQNEWRLMDSGEFSNRARKTMWTLIDVIKQIEPKSENQKVMLRLLIDESLAAWSARRERIEKIGIGMPMIEWFVLVAGALVTIIFTYFFTISVGKAQLIMTGMVSFMVAINLYMVLLFGNPYSGDLKIDTTAFRVLEQYIQTHLTSLDDASEESARKVLSQVDGQLLPDLEIMER